MGAVDTDHKLSPPVYVTKVQMSQELHLVLFLATWSMYYILGMTFDRRKLGQMWEAV